MRPAVGEASPRARSGSLAVVSHDATRTGAPIALLGLTAAFQSSGQWSVSIALARGGPLIPDFDEIAPTTTLWSLPGGLSRHDARVPAKIARWLERRGFRRWLRTLAPEAVVYLNTIMLGHLVDLARRRGHRVVTHVHELETWIDRHADRRFVGRALSESDLVIAASNAVRDNLIRRHSVPVGRVFTVPSAVDLHSGTRIEASTVALRGETGIGSSDLVILGVGTADWRKGIDLFVEMAIRSIQRDPRLLWVWVGAGDAKSIAAFEARSLSAGCADRLQFVGEVADVRPYYQLADIFCLSSREDPYPLVMIEAASQGLPVIAFKGAGGASEFLANGGGLLIDQVDADAMSDAIVALAQDENARDVLSAQARVAAAGHDVSVAAAKITELVQTVASL